MEFKSYAEVEKKFKLEYMIKCKQRGFTQKQTEFFERTPMIVLARQSLAEQIKMVDYVTKNTVDACTVEQVERYYYFAIRCQLGLHPTNQADIGNIAYILTKIGNVTLVEEWIQHLKAKY